MKRFIISLIMAVLVVFLPACSVKPESNPKEQTIIELALYDLRDEINAEETNGATLEFLLINKDIPWLDWDCAYYILTVNGKQYVVGVQEKGDEVHFVDVIDEYYPDGADADSEESSANH